MHYKKKAFHQHQSISDVTETNKTALEKSFSSCCYFKLCFSESGNYILLWWWLILLTFFLQINCQSFFSTEVNNNQSQPSSEQSTPTSTFEKLQKDYQAELAEVEKKYAESQERRGAKVGRVVSIKNAKTVTVQVDYQKYFPKYDVYRRQSSRIMAHDEQEAANFGDIVRIVPSRPFSARKRHLLKDVISRNKLSKFDPVRTKKEASTPN